MRIYIVILLSIFTFICSAQEETEYLTKNEIEKDLLYLDDILQNKSSYQGLNGYDYKKKFNDYLENVTEQNITRADFQYFLTKIIGKIGDRHSYVKGERLRSKLFFPFAFAPFQDKVLVIDYNRTQKEYGFYDKEFPHLKSINKIPIEELLPKIFPGEILAPKSSYATRSIRELRDIEKIFKYLKIDLPNPISVTLKNEKGIEKEINVELVTRKGRAKYWDERIYRDTYLIRDEHYNNDTIVDRFFEFKSNVGYIELIDMVDKEESPLFFKRLNKFMNEAKKTKALIIDVRDNGGGTRHIIQELAT